MKMFLTAILMIATSMACTTCAMAQGPWSFQHETLLMKLHTTHGASTEDVFGMDPAYRFAVSYMRETNVGARISFFNYDHEGSFAAPGGTRLISLDLENTDFEVFKQYNLSCKTQLEGSAGLRYTEGQVFFPSIFEPNHFEGFGGFLAGRATTQIFTGGSLYARGKYAILGGEGTHDGNGINTPQRFDETRTHSEIGFGYMHPFQFSRVTLTPSFGAEWMNLSGYQIDVVDEHPEADMMLGGLSFGLKLTF